MIVIQGTKKQRINQNFRLNTCFQNFFYSEFLILHSDLCTKTCSITSTRELRGIKSLEAEIQESCHPCNSDGVYIDQRRHDCGLRYKDKAVFVRCHRISVKVVTPSCGKLWLCFALNVVANNPTLTSRVFDARQARDPNAKHVSVYQKGFNAISSVSIHTREFRLKLGLSPDG